MKRQHGRLEPLWLRVAAAACENKRKRKGIKNYKKYFPNKKKC